MSGELNLNGLCVLCTRPSLRSEPLRGKLAELGASPLSIPALEMTPLDCDTTMRGIVQRLDEYATVVWISPAAAELGCGLFRDWWPQWPVGVQWIAVGRGTAAVLEAAGLKAQHPGELGLAQSSDGVLQLPGLADCTNQRILLVKGESGREHLHRTLVDRGAKVDELVLYRRCRPNQGDVELQQALQASRIDVALAFSGESLHNLADMAGRTKNRLDLIPLFVPGARVADIARQLGFQDVTSVPCTDDEVMLEALLDRFGSRQ